MKEILYIGESFKKHCKQANNDGVFFEGVHNYKITVI